MLNSFNTMPNHLESKNRAAQRRKEPSGGEQIDAVKDRRGIKRKGARKKKTQRGHKVCMPLYCNCIFELCEYSSASLTSVPLLRHLPFSNQQVQIQEMVLRLYLRLCKMKKTRSHECGV